MRPGSGGLAQTRRQRSRRTSGTVRGSKSAARSRSSPPDGVLTHNGQIGMGQHGQRDVTMPSRPGADLILVEPNLALGGLEARASRPEEFHLRPLTERCGSLSTHTAPTKQPTASLPPRSPPVASWTLKTTAWPNPFALAALPAFIARTGWSVPVLRIGTLASWWSPLGLLPWHRSDRFPQFHMRARIRLAPPLRRSPSAPYPGVRRTDPRGSRSLWF
jgi:hypothetical protein